MPVRRIAALKTLAIALLLALAAVSLLSLVLAADYIETRLPGGLPVGNVLAALVFVAGAGIAVVLGRRGTRVGTVSRGLLLVAVAWLPLSIGLAGNPELNFSGARGSAWLAMSLALLVAVCCTVPWAAVSAWRGAPGGSPGP